MEPHKVRSWLECAVYDMAESEEYDERESIADRYFNDEDIIMELIGDHCLPSDKDEKELYLIELYELNQDSDTIKKAIEKLDDLFRR